MEEDLICNKYTKWIDYQDKLCNELLLLEPIEAIKKSYDLNNKFLDYLYNFKIDNKRRQKCVNAILVIFNKISDKCKLTKELLQFFIEEYGLNETLKDFIFHLILVFHRRISDLSEAKELLNIVKPYLILLQIPIDFIFLTWFALIECDFNENIIKNHLEKSYYNKCQFSAFLRIHDNINFGFDFIFNEVELYLENKETKSNNENEGNVMNITSQIFNNYLYSEKLLYVINFNRDKMSYIDK